MSHSKAELRCCNNIIIAVIRFKWGIKFKIVNQVKEYAINKQYNILDIDGVKVLFNDGWALVRASNTGPNLTARFEANTLDRLEELQKEFVNLINELNK